MGKETDIDLTKMSTEQVLVGMGDLLMNMLATNKVAIVLMSNEGAVTFLNPLLVRSIDPEDLAKELLNSWSEDEVMKVLEHIYE